MVSRETCIASSEIRAWTGRIRGVSRALYDPVLGAMKNLSVQTLIMSGRATKEN
ncbi:hypothetical protein ACFVH4_17820 [Nocardia ignorata]|uniref:hypothetical protein n=1 Tax=Nocardia ignorata TaxID=145285 RepID=UPI0036435105